MRDIMQMISDRFVRRASTLFSEYPTLRHGIERSPEQPSASPTPEAA